MDRATWRSVIRTLVILALLVLAGCTTLPHGAVTWHGHTDPRIKVQVASLSALPAQGWLVESERDQATGFISFAKWGPGNFRYRKQTYFQIKDKWEPDVIHIGRFETKNGSSEFCAVNPQHGGFQEGDTFVITNSYDYCARLARD